MTQSRPVAEAVDIAHPLLSIHKATRVSSEVFSDWMLAATKPMILAKADLTVAWANFSAQELLEAGDLVAVRHGRLISPLADVRSEIQAICGQQTTGIIAIRHPDDALTVQCVLRVTRLHNAEGKQFLGLEVGTGNPIPGDWIDAVGSHYHLTKRQAQVVAALISGMTAEELADALDITVDTARTHIRTIYQKLGVKSREQLFAKVRPFYQ